MVAPKGNAVGFCESLAGGRGPCSFCVFFSVSWNESESPVPDSVPVLLGLLSLVAPPSLEILFVVSIGGDSGAHCSDESPKSPPGPTGSIIAIAASASFHPFIGLHQLSDESWAIIRGESGVIASQLAEADRRRAYLEVR